ncbi:MAG: hypothetical protein U0Y68_20215 [Blastocatellia bacterium]
MQNEKGELKALAMGDFKGYIVETKPVFRAAAGAMPGSAIAALAHTGTVLRRKAGR